MAMSNDEFHSEQLLRDIYYNPSSGYGSADHLYRSAKEKGLKITMKEVKDWLRTQDTYSKFKAKRKPTKYQRVFVSDLGDQLQMDLVDMKKYKNSNDDQYWILTAIEILSRYAFAVPVRRKDTANMTDAVEEVLKSFREHFSRLPDVVQFDQGTEFYNVGVKQLFDDYKIKYFSSHTERKASVVERFNRTLKTRMWKYFNAKDTKVWTDALEDFVRGYNNSYHRTLKMKPKDVNEENKDIVFATLYGYGVSETDKAKFKVGDSVRIHKYKNTFGKGFEANFTDEIFTITKVHRGDPNMYEIADDKGVQIVGKFYENEITNVH